MHLPIVLHRVNRSGTRTLCGQPVRRRAAKRADVLARTGKWLVVESSCPICDFAVTAENEETVPA